MAIQSPKFEHDLDGELRPHQFIAVHKILAVSGKCLARVGKPCSRVPRCDLAWLLMDGHIMEASVSR